MHSEIDRVNLFIQKEIAVLITMLMIVVILVKEEKADARMEHGGHKEKEKRSLIWDGSKWYKIGRCMETTDEDNRLLVPTLL
jgi:hypothetical protein